MAEGEEGIGQGIGEEEEEEERKHEEAAIHNHTGSEEKVSKIITVWNRKNVRFFSPSYRPTQEGPRQEGPPPPSPSLASPSPAKARKCGAGGEAREENGGSKGKKTEVQIFWSKVIITSLFPIRRKRRPPVASMWRGLTERPPSQREDSSGRPERPKPRRRLWLLRPPRLPPTLT